MEHYTNTIHTVPLPLDKADTRIREYQIYRRRNASKSTQNMDAYLVRP